MEYKKAKMSQLEEIIKLKNEVKQRVIKEGLPIWQNGYPLDEMIIEDIENNEGRIVVIDNKIVAYSCFHHAIKEYGKGVFKKDNVQSFGRLMVSDLCVGKHVGDFLVRSMIEESKTLGVEGMGILVDECNIKAYSLYRKYGFRKEGAQQFPYAYLDILGLYF
ncbi:MAG: GNAT family N-acetyltransferase [Erysipelotrichaceae bacterium]|nr:GNAT family N-acetyltransferase [Erysipelotrichaceae bacterium]